MNSDDLMEGARGSATQIEAVTRILNGRDPVTAGPLPGAREGRFCRTTLPCGISTWVRRIPGASVCRIRLFVETPGGLASGRASHLGHLLEHLMCFAYGSRATAESVGCDRMGGRWHGYCMEWAASALPGALTAVLHSLRWLFEDPGVSHARIESEERRIRLERAGLDRRMEHFRYVEYLLRNGFPYLNRRPRRFAPADPGELAGLHRQWYRPARAWVVIAGPHRCERVIDDLAAAFEGFPAADPEYRMEPDQFEVPSGRRILIRSTAAAEAVPTVVAIPAQGWADPLIGALGVLWYTLHDKLSDLKYPTGLAYTSDTRLTDGYLWAAVWTWPGNTSSALSLIEEAYEAAFRILAEPEGLAIRRRKTARSFFAGCWEPEAVTAAYVQLYGGFPAGDPVVEFLRRMMRVTPEEIEALRERFRDRARRTTIEYYPPLQWASGCLKESWRNVET